MSALTYEDIRQAAALIQGQVRPVPVAGLGARDLDALADALGAPPIPRTATIWLALETPRRRRGRPAPSGPRRRPMQFTQ